MRAHRVLGDDERIGNPVGGAALGEQVHDFYLATREAEAFFQKSATLLPRRDLRGCRGNGAVGGNERIGSRHARGSGCTLARRSGPSISSAVALSAAVQPTHEAPVVAGHRVSTEGTAATGASKMALMSRSVNKSVSTSTTTKAMTAPTAMRTIGSS